MGRARPRRVACLQALSALVLASAAASGEVYRYLDGAGRVHYTSDLRQVPADQQDAARAAAAGRPPVNRATSEGGAAPLQAPGAFPPSASPAAPSPAADDVETYRGRDEVWWRAEHGRLVTRVTQLERQIEELEEQGADHAPNPWNDRISERRYHRYRDRHLAWERATREVEQARAALERFEELARTSGVPPGWLR